MPADFNNLKRKKKRSFVQQVKKKFKNARNIGHGTHLDQDTHEYFLRVFEQSRQPFENVEEKRIFVENVFAETIDHEVEYSKNQLVSRVLENLLPFTGDDTFERFSAAFADNLRPVCVHEYASHVLEELICVSTNRVHEKYICGSSDSPSLSNYNNSASFAFVIKISKFLANNLDEFVIDNYANHVLRAAVSCLANINPDKRRDKGKVTNSKVYQDSPSLRNGMIEKVNAKSEFNPTEFVSILVEIAEKILNSPCFVDFPYDTLMSGLLQTVLKSLYVVKKKFHVKAIIKKLLTTTYHFSNSDLSSKDRTELFECQPVSRLLETVLDVCGKKQLKKIHEQCFAGHLAQLAKGRCSHFAVRKLVQRCDDNSKFLEIYAELSEGTTFHDILSSPINSVLISVASACRRLDTKQATFVKDISKALDTQILDTHGGIAYALVRAMVNSGESFSDKKPSVSLKGSVMLQEILRFRKRAKVVESLLAIDDVELVAILCDPCGSHVADAFFASDSCTNQDIERIVEKLKGSLAKLAASKHGSFVITSLWKHCPSIDVKLAVVEELANSPMATAPANLSEHLISSMIALEAYRRHPKMWKEAQMKIVEARDAFQKLATEPIHSKH